ncbi:hypothetical protein AS888_00025 [Peribacillus simplex]|uniref:Uncharacterized protein n=1 Tax=Peribacillus simplex TaxID=1478 RepID=A0A109N3J5_9BACI|nr:hypothetical protein [Peribacillus simplex]KWW22733.1 hypothetical protein AS888_00025 [Peribacillus simplex]
MLKIDRSEVDKAIENMVMFTRTEKVLADYEEEKQVLVKRENGLNERMIQLQEQHAQLLVDREVTRDNTSDYIYLSKQLTSTDEDMKIIISLLEQSKEDFKALKQKHLPIIRNSFSMEISAKSEFPVNEVVDLVKYELLTAIADYASEVSRQQAPLMPAIYEFLHDEELMETNRGFRRAFDYDKASLTYWAGLSKSVISKNEIHSACGGNLPSGLTKPKEKDVAK